MQRGLLIAAAMVMSTATGSSQARLQQNQPGMPTVAQMYVLNRLSSEAIPVTIQNSGEPVPVVATGVINVATTGTSAVATHLVRQAWEYRQLVASGPSVIDQLNLAGNDGWEAVTVSNGPAGSSTILLKRPR
jgi:hypothetical protein